MISINKLLDLKKQRPISMVTCYDYPSALILEESDIDMVLLGDSVGEVIYGFPNTTQVTMGLMINHCKAVKKGLKNKHLLVDMPFRSYHDPAKALSNAKRLMEAGANSLKLEIPAKAVVEALITNDIPVMGHIGLTPQTNQNYQKQGKTLEEAKRIYSEGLALEQWGVYALLLEAVTQELAEQITKQVRIPTIGIASGAATDGQVLVWHDLLRLFNETRGYVKPELNLFENILQALNRYHRRM